MVFSRVNYSNIRLPLAIDRVLRWFIVTSDMHRIHSSVVPEETNSNFGFDLALWDRLLCTYRSQSFAGHAAVTLGIADYRDRH